MAKFTKTYNIELGDRVEFKRSNDAIIERGVVQDISDFPDIWVEMWVPNTIHPEYKRYEYKRYKIPVYLITNNIDNCDWCISDVKFKKDEPLEFVYNNICEREIIRRYEEE